MAQESGGEEVLSQEEIDDLLHGVGEGADDASVDSTAAPEEAGSGPRPYDFNSQDRILKGNFPALELINEKLAHALKLAMTALLNCPVEVSAGALKATKFGDYMMELPLPASLHGVQLRPLPGHGLVTVRPELISTVVEVLFGGRGSEGATISGRDFSAVEQRVIGLLTAQLYEQIATCWRGVADLQVSETSRESNPQFCNLLGPQDLLLTTRFRCDIGQGGGELQVCYPWVMLEQVRERLATVAPADQEEADRQWAALLQRDLGAARVTLVAGFTETQMTLAQLMSLRPGEIIPVQLPDQVTVRSEGVPLFSGRCGQFDGHYAVQVERTLAASGSQS